MAWKKGQSGNPAGMKPGTKHKRLELLRSHDTRLQKKLLRMALEGDVGALKIISDRLWPRLRAEAMPINIDASSSDLSAKGAAVIDAALSGEVTVDVLRDVLTALYGQARLLELTELEARLSALESTQDAPPWERQAATEPLPLRGRKRRSA